MPDETEVQVAEASTQVGIVLRTRNRPVLLERALRDILQQDHVEWRIALVNDGGDPSDIDAVVARHAEALDGRIEVHHMAIGVGRCAAANRGLRALGAPFAVLHDDDDFWHPSFLGASVAWLLEHEGDAAVVVPTEIVYERERGGRYIETRRVPFWPELTGISYADLLVVNRAVPIAVVYRRSLHDELGYYDETLDTVEDWDFYLRVAARHEIGYLSGPPLAFWTQRPRSTGAAANSMFALADAHARDDARVRDRALRAFVQEYGPGLPLFLGGLAHDAIRRQEEAARRRSMRGVLSRIRSRLGGR